MVSKTAEIRWWSSDKSEMWDWFQENIWKNGEGSSDVRTDYYMKPSDDGTGLKWREGNMEFKFRHAQYEIENGTIEIYLKESFPSELTPKDLPSDAFISVKKNRYRQTVDLSHGFVIHTAEDIEEGCQIEFTEVEIGFSRVYYTISFEAFGRKGAELDILKETLGLFSLTKACFTVENSAGYAAKLKMLA